MGGWTMPTNGLKADVHFAHADDCYCSQVIIKKDLLDGPIERISFTFSARHKTASAALDEGDAYARKVIADPERFLALFEQDFT
jgi:hypothetical protein